MGLLHIVIFDNYNLYIIFYIGIYIMVALSIQLPDDLSKASTKAARTLGVSRSHFIRQAILHELQNVREQFEQEAIAKSMIALRKSKAYLQESEELESLLNSPLPEDQEKWWTK